MSKTPLLGYGANLGNSAASSLLFPDLSALPAFVQQTGMQSLRLCYSAGAFLYGDPAYAEGLMACAKTLTATGCQITLAIDHLDNTVRLGDGSPQHRLSVEDVVNAWDKLLTTFPAFVMDLNEIGQQLGTGPNQDFITFLAGVGQGIRALHPGCKICLPCPGFSNTIEDLDHDWGGKTVYQTIVDAWGFAPHYVPVHDYSDGTDVARYCQSKTGIPNVVVQEFHDGALWSASDNAVLLRVTPSQERTSARLTAYKACGVTAAFGWAYCNPVYENISYGWPTLNGEGQFVDNWYKEQQMRYCVALPCLNPILQAKNSSVALRGQVDPFDYNPPTARIFDVSDLTPAQKAKQLWRVTSDQNCGIYGYYGDYSGNRCLFDYTLEGSADGKTFALLPNAPVPATQPMLSASVTNDLDRDKFHCFDLTGINYVKVTLLRGGGFQGGQVSFRADIFDASACVTQADFDALPFFRKFGDSITTLDGSYEEGMDARIATVSYPAPVFMFCGASGIHTADWFNDTATCERILKKPGKFVIVSLGSNTLAINGVGSIQGQYDDLDNAIRLINAAGKIALVEDCPRPVGPTYGHGTVYSGQPLPNGLTLAVGDLIPDDTTVPIPFNAMANVRQAQDDVTVKGVPMRTFMASYFHRPGSCLFLGSLDQLTRDNPGVMRTGYPAGDPMTGPAPGDLHPADFTLYKATEALWVQTKVFGETTPPAPIAAPALPVQPVVDTTPATTPTPAPVATATVTTPVITPPTAATTPAPATSDTAGTAGAAGLTAAQVNTLIIEAEQPLLNALTNLQTRLDADEAQLAQNKAANAGSGADGSASGAGLLAPGWTVDGKPAYYVQAPQPVWGAVPGGLWVSGSPDAQMEAGPHTFAWTRVLAEASPQTLRVLADDYVTGIEVNAEAQGGIPYISYQTPQQVTLSGLQAGVNVLRLHVTNAGSAPNACGVCAVLSPLVAPTAQVSA